MTLDDLDPETRAKIKSYGVLTPHKVEEIMRSAVGCGEHGAFSSAVVLWLCSYLLVMLCGDDEVWN
jgi:hypothetical protein